MAAFQKFNAFVEAMPEKVHNLGSDSLKVMLCNVAPVAANSVKADLTEISAGNGYSAGGSAATVSSSAQSSGTYKLVIADVTFTAVTGTMATFRYAVLYNDTPASKNLIGFWDYGFAISLAAAESFVVDFDATNGVIQLA